MEGIDPAYPKTTDGTTSSIIRKTPRRIVQQLPTGVVEADEESPWLDIVAGFVYRTKILPYADEDYDLIQKSWLAIEGGLTFGSACSYAPFINHDGYFSPDMSLPYWGDIFLQRGKKSGYACSYVFMRSWWQKADIEALIDSESKLSAASKKRGEKYESTWDVTALKKVLDGLTEKDDSAKTPADKDRNLETSGIELVTGFQKGVSAKFLTFNPATQTIVRTKVNKDPRGKMPIDWMYGDIDGNNPLGRGVVELIGGLQNLIDADMQMYQFNRALALAPPVIKYGNIGNFRYAPNTVINARSDPNAKIIPLVVDTTAIANYPALYGLQKSQLLNLVNSPDTSISADVGNPGFGKTPAALNQQKATLSIDDNYIRKMFETWFGNWSETAINLFFAERSGVEELQLDKETAKKLRRLAEEVDSQGNPKFDVSMLSSDDKILIDYDSATPALKFRVNASTSKMKDDSDQLAALQSLLNTLDSSPVLAQLVPPEKILGAWNSIVAASGVEDPEDLSIDIDAFIQEKAMQEQAAPAEMPPEAMPPEGAPMEGMPAPTEQAMPQPPMPTMSPEDEQIIAHLQALNIPDPVIQQAIHMLEQGASADQILEALGVTHG